MINFRKGTFETNSSSAHSIIISKNHEFVDPNEVKKELLKGGMLYIESTCFDENFELLTNWKEKLAYVAADIKDDENKLYELVKMLESYCPSVKGICSDFPYNDSIYDNDNMDIPVYDGSDNIIGSIFGVVNHQSRHYLTESIDQCLLKQPEYNNDIKSVFKDIVFSNRFIIVIDSDSCNTILDVLKEGLLDEMKVDKILKVSYDFNTNKNTTEFLDYRDYLKEELN